MVGHRCRGAQEFEHWHSHEHFPERLALPGFLRALRWADAGGGPCRVLDSSGSTVAGHALTLRCSPAAAGEQQRLHSHLRALVRALPAQPGLVGAQLLQTDKPAIAPTTEQRLRGLADQAADWIFIATGYDAPVLARLAESALSAAALQNAGAAAGSVTAAYGLRGASTSAEAC
ncbi:hypothetical protein [Roseateles cavernae]|uniref:hypothetical protein n=1 Tax=Roseateles cavernae TaxID=3153578 RepID=UPI0032E3FB3B